MAAITPGANGTLKSVTLENSLYEALTLLLLAEADSVKNPQNLNKIIISVSQNNRRISAGFSFDLQKDFDAEGGIVFRAKNYLSNLGYAAGTEGTLLSPTLPRVIVEIAERMQSSEQDLNKNPNSINGITSLIHDSETLRVDGAVSLECVAAVSAAGLVEIKTKPYLLD